MPRARALLCLILVAGAGLRVWYASHDLHPGRFWDERYALLNVTSILEQRNLLPVKSYYPSPLFNLPAAAAVAVADRGAEAVGVDPRRVYHDGNYGPWGYFICRSTQVLAGVLAIGLIFRLGRRLSGPTAGLVAAAAIAFAPWPIHASGIFKPDALVLCTIALAIDLALSAVRRPTYARYALAGLGIALAASAKLTGVTVALVVAIGSLWPGEDRRQRLVGLALAAVSSVVFFFVLNPYGRWYPLWVSSLKKDYAMRAGWEEMSRASVLADSGRLLMDGTMFGPFFGAIALLALGMLTVGALRRRDATGRDWAMLSVFPCLYAVIYATQTPYFKTNNLFPGLPASAVALGWALSASTQLVLGGSRRWLRAAALTAAVAALALPGWRYVYASLVPTTLDAALHRVSSGLKRAPAGRLLFIERSLTSEGIAWEGKVRYPEDVVAAVAVDAIGDLDPVEVAGADALFFAPERFDGPQGEVYRSFLPAAARGQELRQVRRPFAVRGSEVVIRLKAWRPKRPRRRLTLRRCEGARPGCWLATPAEPIAERTMVSLVLLVPWSVLDEWEGTPKVEVAGRQLALHRASRRTRQGFIYTTARFRWLPVAAGGAVEIGLDPDLADAAVAGVVAEAHRWRNAARSSS